MESVSVETSETGEPVTLTRGGRQWTIGAEPLRWYERVPWWELSPRAARGSAPRVDVEVWRVQARVGTNPRSDLATFDLEHDRDKDTWAVRSVNLTK